MQWEDGGGDENEAAATRGPEGAGSPRGRRGRKALGECGPDNASASDFRPTDP